ncbi:MAG: HAD family hydrolase [Proteobacteria bacterium]|nr:HAD family hydrolase [Pseudomonadota bacterium]
MGCPVILDRDGTIVVDDGYLHDPARLRFLPGAAEGLQMLHAAGHPLIVISNQSGVGRGLFTLAQLEAVNRRFVAMLQEAGAPLSGLYFCPHDPRQGCACRKPNTALLLRAAAELDFAPSTGVVIGDKSSDIELGTRVGATTILVTAAGSASDGRPARPDYTARDLAEAARIIAQARAPCAPGTALEEDA